MAVRRLALVEQLFGAACRELKMPEGDTIFLLAKKLAARLTGHVVTHYDAWEPSLRRDDVVGWSITGASARGKNLLIEFSSGETLHSHLRMDGKWHLRQAAPLPQAYGDLNMVIGFPQVALLGYQLPLLRWVDLQRLPASDPLRALGPDLLGDEVDVHAIASALAALGELPIGVAVMRQGVMAGVGNEYKSELLFLEHVHPEAPVGRVSIERLSALVQRARMLLRRNVVAPTWGARGRQTRPRVGGGGSLWVYGRGGEHCLVCDDRIVVTRQGQPPRSTYYCPTCQPRAIEP